MIFVIRTDVSPEIGNGHLMRCIAFCSKFKLNGVQTHLITNSLPFYIKEILDQQRIKFHCIDLQINYQLWELHTFVCKEQWQDFLNHTQVHPGSFY